MLKSISTGLFATLVAASMAAPVAARQGAPVYNVGIAKSASPDVSVGAAGEWLLQPFNAGPAPATKDLGITVIDQLPANFAQPVKVMSNGNWKCVVTGLTIKCTYIGPPVQPGQPFPPIKIAARAIKSGGYENCATISLVTDVAVDVALANNKSCKGGKVLTPAFDMEIDPVVNAVLPYTNKLIMEGWVQESSHKPVAIGTTLKMTGSVSPAGMFTASLPSPGALPWGCTGSLGAYVCTHTVTAQTQSAIPPLKIALTVLAGNSGNPYTVSNTLTVMNANDPSPGNNVSVLNEVIP